MARETALWDSLALAKPILRERLHIHRIENWASPGMPDVEGFFEGQGQFWFELKSEARPKRNGPIRFKMRPKQIEWANRRWRIGGACFWLLQVGHAWDRQVYMLEGDQGDAINSRLTEEQLRELDILKNPKFDPVEAIRMAFR